MYVSRQKLNLILELACVASVSVGFQSRERPKNDILVILPSEKMERGGGGKE